EGVELGERVARLAAPLEELTGPHRTRYTLVEHLFRDPNQLCFEFCVTLSHARPARVGREAEAGGHHGAAHGDGSGLLAQGAHGPAWGQLSLPQVQVLAAELRAARQGRRARKERAR